jgi:hypothetical protein
VPAGPIGPAWGPGSWADDAWEEGSWGGPLAADAAAAAALAGSLDTNLLETIQYATMEAPDLGATWPSGLWTRQEVLDLINERQARFLKASLIQLALAEIPAVLAGQTVIALPTDWIATVSVVWEGADGTVVELIRSDTFEADHGMPGWTITGAVAPLVYMDYATPTLQLQIGPAPQFNGVVQLLYVAQPATITGDGDTYLSLPPEFAAAAAKYGPLADLFAKQGRGKNPEKAAYAESRYALGLQAAAIILDGRR